MTLIKTVQLALNEINTSFPIVGEYMVNKALDFAFNQLNRKKELLSNSVSDDHFIREFKNIDIFKQYVNGVLSWSETENIIRGFNPKFNSHYYVYQTFSVFGNRSLNKPLKLSDVFSLKKNYIFKGGPGTGKTTLLKHLLNTSSEEKNFIKVNKYFPYLLRCRELTVSTFKPNIKERDDKLPHKTISQERLQQLTERSYILTTILNDLGFYIRFPNSFANDDTYISWVREMEGFFLELIDKNSFCLLIDGFDEIQEEITKYTLVELLSKVALKCPNCNFILTSRDISSLVSISNVNFYELNFFNEKQLNLFVNKWFKHSKKNGEILKEKFKNRPYYDTLCRPLTLAFICVLFEKNNNDIPQNSTEIYYQIIELLVYKWEADNRIRRQSKYIGFTKEKKIRFLAEFTYNLSIPNAEKEFRKANMKVYLKLLLKKYMIPLDELEDLVIDIENHTGLFLDLGNKYCFSHYSLQEFLTAFHIFNIGSITINQDLLKKLPEVPAICVALSSNPSEYFTDLYLQVLSRYTGQNMEQILRFIERLVTEQPDFEESEFLGVYILALYSGLIVKKDNFNKNLNEKFAERVDVSETSNIDDVFRKIFDNEVLKASINEAILNYTYNFDLNNNFCVLKIKEYLKHSEKRPFPRFLLFNRELLNGTISA